MWQLFGWLSEKLNRGIRRSISALAFFTCVLIAFSAHADELKDADAALARKDYATAIAIWSELADTGNAEAMLSLGVLYLNGTGVTADVARGVSLIKKSATAGFAPAQSILGNLYLRGESIKQDKTQARYWLERAARQGYGPAQITLGTSIWLGGTQADRISGLMWIELALRSMPDADPLRGYGVSRRDMFRTMMTPDEIEKAEMAAKEFGAETP